MPEPGCYWRIRTVVEYVTPARVFAEQSDFLERPRIRNALDEYTVTAGDLFRQVAEAERRIGYLTKLGS